jgi:exo-beta-1,3-glucanase (GH17 family)
MTEQPPRREATMRAKLATLLLIALVLGATYWLRPKSSAPKPLFEVKPKYINPTDSTVIRFIAEPTETEDSPATYKWLIDGTFVNSTRDHWCRLPAGNHTVRLIISHEETQTSYERTITVERSNLYPQMKLVIPIKGICYNIGVSQWQPAFRPPETEEMIEDLKVIRDELGCNAIRIFGDFETEMLECARTALSMGFTTVALSPRYIGVDTDETERRLMDFAAKANSLINQSSAHVILFIGNELTLDTKDLAEDKTNLGRPATQLRLNQYLQRITNNIRQVFKGQVSYAAGHWEDVRWNELPFDIAAMNVYLNAYNTETMLERIYELQRTRKPVWITEFGSCTYSGAFQYGGTAYEQLRDQEYSQEAQAAAISATLNLLNETKVDACFLWKYKAYKLDDRESYGILRFDGTGFSRKLGFYIYASYSTSRSDTAMRGNQTD